MGNCCGFIGGTAGIARPHFYYRIYFVSRGRSRELLDYILGRPYMVGQTGVVEHQTARSEYRAVKHIANAIGHFTPLFQPIPDTLLGRAAVRQVAISLGDGFADPVTARGQTAGLRASRAAGNQSRDGSCRTAAEQGMNWRS